MSGITIRAVHHPSDLMEFIKLPWKIYRNDPLWVPPLIGDRKKLLDRKKNPFYKHAEMELFLAEKDHELVGRIGAIINHRHNHFHNENIGFFGFYESINDQNVANALFDSAKQWLRAKGIVAMRGPANPSMNDECGLLIQGFEYRPAILMTYNLPYYIELFEQYGLRKAKDLYAYFIEKSTAMSEKILRVASYVKKKENVKIRPLNMKDFNNEIRIVKEIYNKAWSYNWGFVPMTDEEIEYVADDLKQIVDPDMALFAEINGQHVGFSLALPDINMALKHVKNGRLFPFGLVKILWYRRFISLVRFVILGVIKEYQRRGIDGLFYVESFQRGVPKGYHQGEASWVLEDNEMMKRAAASMNARLYKIYRMYEMPI